MLADQPRQAAPASRILETIRTGLGAWRSRVGERTPRLMRLVSDVVGDDVLLTPPTIRSPSQLACQPDTASSHSAPSAPAAPYAAEEQDAITGVVADDGSAAASAPASGWEDERARDRAVDGHLETEDAASAATAVAQGGAASSTPGMAGTPAAPGLHVHGAGVLCGRQAGHSLRIQAPWVDSTYSGESFGAGVGSPYNTDGNRSACGACMPPHTAGLSDMELSLLRMPLDLGIGATAALDMSGATAGLGAAGGLVDRAPNITVAGTPLDQVHMQFSVLGLERTYVVFSGRILGVIRRSQLGGR